jgi:hypothetical protein
MSEPQANPARALPRWLVLLGSAAVAFHIFALCVLAVAAPSGPWPGAVGTTMGMEPPFAAPVSAVTTRYYLLPLKMSHNYHFATNRPGTPAASFEVRLKDDKGQVVQTLKFPDEHANCWVRHRQALLAQELADDVPIPPRQGEVIPAPGQQVPNATFWDPAEDGGLRLKTTPEHLVPRDRPVFRPSEWSMLLARSYVRHLCREYGGASGEVIRRTREPIAPDLMFVDEPPAAAFDTLVANFGEFSR